MAALPFPRVRALHTPTALATMVFALFAGPPAARSQAFETNADHLGGMLHPTALRPGFEVAAIRPSAPGAEFRFNGIGMRPGSLEVTGTTVREMIAFAYAVPDDTELSGGPGWIRSERFDIRAKVDDADLPMLKALPPSKLHDAMRLRLQVLLEQRFGLRMSFPGRVLPLLLLQEAKGGLRCRRTAAENAAFFDNPSPPPPPPPEGGPPLGPGHEGEREQLHWRAAGLPFPLIVSWISEQPEVRGRTIADRTGLKGTFDCEIHWTRDEAHAQDTSSLFPALREQMGLRLRPQRGAVETLVVDRIERPSAN